MTCRNEDFVQSNGGTNNSRCGVKECRRAGSSKWGILKIWVVREVTCLRRWKLKWHEFEASHTDLCKREFSPGYLSRMHGRTEVVVTAKLNIFILQSGAKCWHWLASWHEDLFRCRSCHWAVLNPWLYFSCVASLCYFAWDLFRFSNDSSCWLLWNVLRHVSKGTALFLSLRRAFWYM